jgi:uncharacterized membrane protein YsdA (DUF1294 family)
MNEGRLSPLHFLALAILLAAPSLALWLLAPRFFAAMCTLATVLASVATYALYASDKHRARVGAWRTPESTLHIFELLGGWPGAFLAQRRLRHKSSKGSYLFVFWLIVAVHNYAAFDAFLGWRLTRAATQRLGAWADAASPDSPPSRSTVY